MICYIDYRKPVPTTAQNAPTSVPLSGRRAVENPTYGTWCNTSSAEYETPIPGKAANKYETPIPANTENAHEVPNASKTEEEYETPNPGNTENEYEIPNPGNEEEENIYEAIPI